LVIIFQEYIESVKLPDPPLEQDSDDDEIHEEESEDPPTKTWNFPKKHLRQHLFSNIEDKGVSRNSSTKPNERMHGPVKNSYLHRSNFKNYGDQVCCCIIHMQAEHPDYHRF
jgi:vacuolar-type H+-ATPase subunit I/STV1